MKAFSNIYRIVSAVALAGILAVNSVAAQDIAFNRSVAAVNPAHESLTVSYQLPVLTNGTEVQRNFSYPKVCKHEGIEGKVVLKLYIEQDGKVSRHKVVSSTHPSFEAEVIAHLGAMKFAPAQSQWSNGSSTTIASWVVVPFEFSLEE